MKILIANKFYYPRGGDCIYAIGLEKLLTDAGHEVAFFAMDYPENLDSFWKQYWPSEVSFSPKKSLQFLHAFARPFGDKETKQKFTDLLDVFKPDVVHLNNIHTQLSPVIAEIAHARGIKVVWTLHDHKLICPAYLCHSQGKICEKCFCGDKSFCLKNKCVKNNWLASFIAMKEATVWNKERLISNVDTFICPSEFLKRQMLKGGFPENKIQVLPNFIDLDKIKGERLEKQAHYCYVGRLSEEKGIRTLLNVASSIPNKLKILGTGPLARELQDAYHNCTQIEFMGFQNWDVCRQVIASASFSVMPSECYENYPFAVIESLCLGTPVLGANIGGIPELIKEGMTGELFESGNKQELVEKLQIMIDKTYSFDYEPIAAAFSKDVYLAYLLNLYSEVAKQ